MVACTLLGTMDSLIFQMLDQRSSYSYHFDISLIRNTLKFTHFVKIRSVMTLRICGVVISGSNCCPDIDLDLVIASKKGVDCKLSICHTFASLSMPFH
jgi:hypothetical protein